MICDLLLLHRPCCTLIGTLQGIGPRFLVIGASFLMPEFIEIENLSGDLNPYLDQAVKKTKMAANNPSSSAELKLWKMSRLLADHEPTIYSRGQ